MISAESDIAFREFLLFRDRDINLINILVLYNKYYMVFITIDGYMFLESLGSSVPFAAERRTCTDISLFLRTRLSTVISA